MAGVGVAGDGSGAGDEEGSVIAKRGELVQVRLLRVRVANLTKQLHSILMITIDT